MDALGLREIEPVDGIAPVGRQRDAVAGFRRLAAGLRVLPGDPSHLHHRYLSRVGHHHGHRQLHQQLVLDVLGRHRVEGLSAVATLQQERPTLGHLRELAAEVIALPCEDQRRQLLHGVDHAIQGGLVRVAGLLEHRKGTQLSPGHDRHAGKITSQTRRDVHSLGL